MDTKSAIGERTTRIKEFLTARHALMRAPAPDVNRLAPFLEATRGRWREPLPVPQTAAEGGRATLELLLDELHGALNKARSRGFGFNPWTVAGLRRNEVRACGVLAALWNPAMCGDAAAQFLKEFLGELRGVDALAIRDELRQGYIVRTEHILQGDRTTRMDITIEGTGFVLVVEVKIDAVEGTDQFARLRAHTKAWAEDRGKRPLFALLSPWEPPGDFGDVHTDWRAVARAARRCLPPERSTYTFHHHMLVSFADHVSNF
jgi:hypothetical protein